MRPSGNGFNPCSATIHEFTAVNLWLAIATMTAAATAILLAPLIRKRKSAAVRGAHDLTVYRHQLAELDRDAERGILKPEEAAAARLEIERRILAAGTSATVPAGPVPAGPVPAGPGKVARLAVVVAAILGPLAAIGLYLDLGAPSLPGFPFAERRGESESAKAMSEAQLTKLVAELAQKMEEKPDDPKGWLLLAHSLMTLGRYDEAATAYGRAAALDPKDASVPASQGEALTYAGGGIVTPKARDSFEKALAIDSKEPRSRFYLGLASAQSGEPRAALAAWEALAADAPADAPWLTQLNEQIAKLKETIGSAPKEPGQPAAPAPEKNLPDKNPAEKPAN